MYTTWILTYGLHTVCFNMKWDEITGMKPRNNISSACRRLCFFLDSRIYLWPSMWCFFSLHKSWLNAHMWRCINGGHVKTYKHVYIHILIYIYICIMDTRIYLRIYPTLRELSELLKPLQMVVQLLLPGFQDFALHKHLIQKIHVFHKSWINVCMWKALAKLQWPCRHTHKHIYVQIVKSMVNWLLS